MWKPAKDRAETDRLAFESKPSIGKMKEKALEFVNKFIVNLKEQMEAEVIEADENKEEKDNKPEKEQEKEKEVEGKG